MEILTFILGICVGLIIAIFALLIVVVKELFKLLADRDGGEDE